MRRNTLRSIYRPLFLFSYYEGLGNQLLSLLITDYKRVFKCATYLEFQVPFPLSSLFVDLPEYICHPLTWSPVKLAYLHILLL